MNQDYITLPMYMENTEITSLYSSKPIKLKKQETYRYRLCIRVHDVKVFYGQLNTIKNLSQQKKKS